MTRLGSIAVTITLYLAIVFGDPVQYTNHIVYQVLHRKIEDLKLLARLEAEGEAIVFLNSVSRIENPSYVLVSPQKQNVFESILEANGITFTSVVEDFQKVLDHEQAELQKRSATYDWTGYHTLNETYNWLSSLVQKYPNQVELLIGGNTFEGREIRGVKVSFGTDRKGIFLEAGIHACEWISPATVTFLLNEILSNPDANVRSVVESFDWYVFPHFNPDGYVYTHTTDRLWRKTRSRGKNCDGADPNRNWGFKWMVAGASADECSRNFAGRSEFSEPEMKSLSEFLLTLKGKIHTYVAFHSYGQVLVFPYAATDDRISNYDDLMRIGQATTKELRKQYGTEYEVGTAYDVIYAAAGSSADWAYSALDVPVVFTYELRPHSSPNGFVLPSAQILPSGRETFDSLLGLVREARHLGYYN